MRVKNTRAMNWKKSEKEAGLPALTVRIEVHERVNDAHCGLPVPQFGDTDFVTVVIQDAADCRANRCRMITNDPIGSRLYGHRAFGIATEGDTRHAKNRCFFLKTA